VRSIVAACCAVAVLSFGMWAQAQQTSTNTAQKGSLVYLYRLLAAHPDMMAKGMTAEQTRIMAEHLDHLKSLSDRGLLVISGRTLNNDETTFGIVMFRADSDAAAREIMNSDPGIQKGVFQGVLFPFLITAQGSR
jgi:uncharacterized protein